jgi:hypothetical protein
MEAALITGKANSLRKYTTDGTSMPDEILAFDVYLFCKRMFL